MKYRLSVNEADRLIEKYYDGLTTVAEENQLKKFLMQPEIPEKYTTEQAIFNYFEHKNKNPQVYMRSYLRWGAVAAVTMILIGQHFFISADQSNFAYIDGKKVSDIQEIKSHAQTSLDDISFSKDEVKECLNNLN